MKKVTLMAIAAVAMLFVACAKLSPEAVNAWNDVKEKAASVCSMEAVEQMEDFDAYNAAVQEFNAACQEMAKYAYTQEISDSFTTMTTKFEEVAQRVVELQMQAAQAAAEAEAEAEGEGEEEVVEE